MANLLRQYTPGYIARYRSQAPPQVQSTLAKLSLCRTAALGERRYHCQTCQTQCHIYNSCGDRHCPQCSGARRANWLTSTSELLLPEIDYYQVVFTLPDKLSSLALGNRRELYNLLFRSAFRALREIIAEEQGFEAAAVMVLHTWNQKLEPHAHVHAIVPGGGPSLSDPRQWVRSQRRTAGFRKGERYLVDADALRERFRHVFVKGLRGLHRQGLLKLDAEYEPLRGTSEFDAWLKPLEEIKWAINIQPPPSQHAAPQHVLKYLARYLTGGPISDRRLIAHQHGQVTFAARTGRTPGGQRNDIQPIHCSGIEFVRRWSLHILPKGYVKTRRFGGYSNRHCQRYLAACRDLLSVDSISPDDAHDSDASRDITPALNEDRQCPHCGKSMHCILATDRPGWSVVMRSSHRPVWYDDG